MDNKQIIYDELCRVLTDYEGNGEPERKGDSGMLYEMLVKIQNNWEDITFLEDNNEIFS